MTRSYGEHVRDQVAAEARVFTQPTADAGDSIVRRYLASSNKIELEAAEPIVAQVRSGSQEEALAAIVKDRRGSRVDILLSLASGGVGYALGKVTDQLSPSRALAVVPGLAASVAGLALKVPYPARVGLAHFGQSWLMGSRSNKEDK